MSSILFSIAKVYIGGKDSNEVVQTAKTLNSTGFRIIANYLGEELSKEEDIQAAVKQYIDLIDIFDENRISGSISVKLTQLGLCVSDSLAWTNLKLILEKAKIRDRYVWIDMENTNYTDRTLSIYLKALAEYRNTGIAIQSYLKRSIDDVAMLQDRGGQVRLVKGAYQVSPEQLVGGKKEIRENFERLLKTVFSGQNFFAVATHDEKLIRLAQNLARETRNENFEFQFLKGVRERRSAQLLADGFKVAIYVPYGENWIPYALRRIKERRRNIWYFLKALFGR